MSDLSRYSLSQHEDGSWHVIDARTGGPAEVEVEGRFMLLWKLSLPQAQAWARRLNEKARKND
jgi:hypothetical protein